MMKLLQEEIQARQTPESQNIDKKGKLPVLTRKPNFIDSLKDHVETYVYFRLV